MGQGDLVGHCASINRDDDCGTHMCACTIDLIDRFIQLLWQEIQMQPQYKHENNFDAVSTCHHEVPTTPPTTTFWYSFTETTNNEGNALIFEEEPVPVELSSPIKSNVNSN